MYQVTIKGRSIQELKQAANDLNEELQTGIISSAKVEKNLEEVKQPEAPAQPEQVVEAPTPAAPQAPVQQVNDDVDSHGIPWDSRIHASTKKQKADGTWKRRKGVDDETFYSVTKELKGSTTPSGPAPTPTPEAPVTPTVEAPTPTPEAPAQPQAAPTPAPAMPTQGSGGHTLETFKANFPLILGTLMSEGKIDQNYVNTLKNHFGISEIWNATDEQKAVMYEGFAEYGFIKKV